MLLAECEMIRKNKQTRSHSMNTVTTRELQDTQQPKGIEMVVVKQILKRIDEPNLDLCKGKGYWYFVFDDGKMFETHSEFTCRLNDYSIDSWVKIGKEFIKYCKDKK